jgi:DNA end-binding protein Ku
MLGLAKHIVEHKSASFEPERFEDRYEAALIGRSAAAFAKPAPKTGGNVINLMGCAQAVSNERDERGADGLESQSKKPKRRIAKCYCDHRKAGESRKSGR